jgi:hypothetical protein
VYNLINLSNKSWITIKLHKLVEWFKKKDLK